MSQWDNSKKHEKYERIKKYSVISSIRDNHCYFHIFCYFVHINMCLSMLKKIENVV